MSTPYVPGPTNWFVNSGANKAFEYLGQCERGTRLDPAPEWEEVYADGAGPRLPYDMQFMGARVGVSGDLIRWNEPVLGRLMNWMNNPNATPGTLPNGSIGTLLRTEGYAFSLAIVSTYGSKQVFTDAGMAPGFLFPFAVCYGSWSTDLSASAKRQRVSFDCIPTMNLLGGGVVWTTNLSGISLPSVN